MRAISQADKCPFAALLVCAPSRERERGPGKRIQSVRRLQESKRLAQPRRSVISILKRHRYGLTTRTLARKLGKTPGPSFSAYLRRLEKTGRVRLVRSGYPSDSKSHKVRVILPLAQNPCRGGPQVLNGEHVQPARLETHSCMNMLKRGGFVLGIPGP